MSEVPKSSVVSDVEVPMRFITRQQERNRKKKLQKKLAKQRRREKASIDILQTSEATSDKVTDSISKKEYPHFDFTGPFERFKVGF